MPRLIDAPASTRLAAGCFACLVLGFVLLAQANLWQQVEGDGPPAPQAVLERYHGRPDRTPLHDVLDPARGLSDPRNMWQYLAAGPEDPAIDVNRRAILDWVDAGAPRKGWATVAPIFTAIENCGACHVAGGEMQRLPFSTYEDARVVARPGAPPPLGPLLVSAHNHLFGFAVLALLLSLGLCTTRVAGLPRALLIVGASGGAALDIAAWFLTRQWGSPFHLLIMTGGGLFGLSTTLMALAVLRDAVAGVPRAGTGADAAP